MSAEILDGKKLSRQHLREIKAELKKLKRPPGLAAILIGDDPSSRLYVKLKKQACEKCDISFHGYYLSDDLLEEKIIETIKFLNNDNDINGILIQLPLPPKYDTDKIIQAIAPHKDVDGLLSIKHGKRKTKPAAIISPLVLGIVELIKSTGEKIKNKKIAILCNHKIFGEPFKYFYGANNHINIATLKDANWRKQLRIADILIVAIGKAKFVKKEMIKNNAIVIDVGINKVNGKTVGDVDFSDIKQKASFISPVPGGVGPMTIAMLLKNLLLLNANAADLR